MSTIHSSVSKSNAQAWQCHGSKAPWNPEFLKLLCSYHVRISLHFISHSIVFFCWLLNCSGNVNERILGVLFSSLLIIIVPGSNKYFFSCKGNFVNNHLYPQDSCFIHIFLAILCFDSSFLIPFCSLLQRFWHVFPVVQSWMSLSSG